MEEEEGRRPLECARCKCLMGFSSKMEPREGERFECLGCYLRPRVVSQERRCNE